MAHENTWSSLEDGQPTGANLLGQVDDFVRQTRKMVRERIALEHDFNLLINDQQGYHRQGSARVWVSDTQPTSPIPDPTSTETVGSETIGRCWFKPSTGEYFVYNNASASWIPVNLTTSQMAALLHAMTAKASLDDNDEFALADSVATYGPKKTLWSTIKSVIKTALSIGGSHALSEDNIGDGVSYKRISATKADKINAGTYSNDDIVDGASYKRIQAAKADKINAGTFSEDDIADGTSYKRVQAAKADKINGGTYSEDDIADGTTYKRIQAAKADAINNETRLPTALGTADANLIGALSKVANNKLFVNAAGNGFEYAGGMKFISTTWDLSVGGTQAITGIGFKPSWGVVLSLVMASTRVAIGIFSNSGASTLYQISGGTWGRVEYHINELYTDVSNETGAAIQSLDSDGLTLNWLKNGSTTGTAYIYALLGR